jgi:hypothetical protein
MTPALEEMYMRVFGYVPVKLKPWDFDKPIMKLSEIKTRARLLRQGTRQ